MKHRTLIAISSVCIGLGFLPRGVGADFIVDIDGGGTHTQIQAAIEDAIDGDTIVVMPGEYEERIDFLGKRIRVRGSDPYDLQVVSATIINARATGRVVTFASEEPGETDFSAADRARGCVECWRDPHSAGALQPVIAELFEVVARHEAEIEEDQEVSDTNVRDVLTGSRRRKPPQVHTAGGRADRSAT